MPPESRPPRSLDSADWTIGEFVPSDQCIDAVASLLLDLAEDELSAAESGGQK